MTKCCKLYANNPNAYQLWAGTCSGQYCTGDVNGYLGDQLTKVLEMTESRIITTREVMRSIDIARNNDSWRFKLCKYYDTKTSCKGQESCPFVHAYAEWKP